MKHACSLCFHVDCKHESTKNMHVSVNFSFSAIHVLRVYYVYYMCIKKDLGWFSEFMCGNLEDLVECPV